MLALTSAASASVDWSKSANVYWLGHDLMWTIDVLLREAPTNVILQGLTQSLHHLRKIGLGNTAWEHKLDKLCKSAQGTIESDWNSKLRIQYATDLRNILNEVGEIANAHQADFDPGPYFR